MLQLIVEAFTDERGQDLIEYGLLAAFISLSGTAAIIALGEAIDELYSGMPAKLP